MIIQFPGDKKPHLCSPMCDMDPWPGPQEALSSQRKKQSCMILKCQLVQLQ